MGDIQADFLQSALTEENPFMPTEKFPAWLEERRHAHAFEIERIPFRELQGWSFEPSTGNLAHASGRFFKIEGIWIETNYGDKRQWSQPIINQAEIGLLGILTKRFGGVLYFLMQAKMEPGNINTVQLAPTLQATRSNFTRVHGGRTPPYLEYFTRHPGAKNLVDVLQSEQGARFLQKRNRNIIIEVTEEVPVLADYCWLTLGQVQKLVGTDNVVNMDARTVLSCIPFASNLGTPAEAHTRAGEASVASGAQAGLQSAIRASLMDGQHSQHSIEEILSWFTELKFRYQLSVERIPLKYVQSWVHTDDDIHHEERKYFSVIAVRVKAANREVASWTQPLVKPGGEGIVAFIMKRIDGVLHFLVQAKVEPGNFDVVEMAPTVQCLTGNFRNVPLPGRPPFLDYVLQAKPSQILTDTLQSEEGGRFFQEANRNLLVEADDEFPLEVPDQYLWMTLRQLKTLIQFNNFINVQARCLLAGLGCR